MATNAVTNTASAYDKLAASLNAGAESEKAAAKNEIGKDAFIKMLVEQLKHQDPTEPIKNEDLAVNLAQFSQVEQLVEINKKLEGGGLGDTASLAAFLGREVLVSGDEVTFEGGKGGSVFFELPANASNVKLEVLNASGSVVSEKDLGEMSSGRQVLDLSDQTIANGSYTVKLTASTLSGETFSPQTSTGGVVTGFIPGADPSLLIGDKEVKATDISLVNSPTA